MFDQYQHKIRLQRAKRCFVSGNEFLVRSATHDILERLSVVKRRFNTAIALFGRTPDVAEALRRIDGVSRVLRVEEDTCLGQADHFATMDTLGLPDHSADLVIAPLTLHWCNDLPGMLIQISRVLRPDGLLLSTLPGPDTLFELRQALIRAESEITGGAAIRVDPFTDIRNAGALLQRAGFALPVVDQDRITVRYDTALDVIRDLRMFGATSQLENNTRPGLCRDIISRVVEIYANQFSDTDGRVRATYGFISLSGWKPHESQQQPLKPGTARSSLAEALDAREVKLKR